MPDAARTIVATSGWAIPRESAPIFDAPGTHLQRYAARLCGTEINSSFYRPHTPATYARWAAATPDDFRFAVKLPKAITHDARLVRARAPLDRFLEETSGLGAKRGPVLVQLPPSFAFDRRLAARFFALLRARYDGPAVCEPRHPTWFTATADALLAAYRIARVAADPAVVPDAAVPGGWPGVVYYRLHGSPRTYWSRYDPLRLGAWADALRRVPAGVEAWCVFDNTASGAALANAAVLAELVGAGRRQAASSLRAARSLASARTSI